eukprot:TRINITY_DN30930_c0_g1_i1.p1 TRINITY_DN30930_c0_g1~~TRINITY_DN30930_c0_g1_i1.p1  ORF type:complete len:502 (+),score=89.78 TRINITY_DN30930_c0_g1_i1:58-1506(+)
MASVTGGPSLASSVSAARKSAYGLIDDLRILTEPSRHPEEPIGTTSIVLNILQSTMGVGILSLAMTLAYAGIAVGITFFLFFCGISLYAVRLLLRALRATGTTNCEDLARACGGTKGAVWARSTVFCLCLVALTAFLVTMKAFLWLVFRQLLSESAWHSFTSHGGSHNLLMIAAVVVIDFPLSLTRRIDTLARTSALGVCCIFYFVVLSVVYMVQNAPGGVSDLHCHELDHDDSPLGGIVWAHGSVGDVLSAFSIVSASFCCVFSVFPIWSEVTLAEDTASSEAKVGRAIGMALPAVAIIYAAAALSGYLVWREVSPRASSILACYPTSHPAVCACYIGMILTLLCTYPVVCFAARMSIASLVYDGSPADMPAVHHWGLTIFLVALTTGIACLTSSLGQVMSIGSSLTTPSVCYLIPAFCFLKSRTMKPHPDDGSDGGESSSSSEVESLSGPELSVAGGWAVVVIGVVCQIAMLLGVVLQLA